MGVAWRFTAWNDAKVLRVLGLLSGRQLGNSPGSSEFP